jgi:hypothetical protein
MLCSCWDKANLHAVMQGMDGEIAAVRADLKELSKDIRIQMEGVQDTKEVRMPVLSRCMCVLHTHALQLLLTAFVTLHTPTAAAMCCCKDCNHLLLCSHQ